MHAGRARFGRRPERRRQDDARQPAHRFARADERGCAVHGQERCRGRTGGACRSRPRARLSAHPDFPAATVAETIAAAVVSRQKKRWRLFSPLAADGEIRARVQAVADIFGLGHRLDTVAATLSQGEKKLLDVASAFALEPQVILLDEPTSGVSTADKHGIMKTLIEAAKRAGVKGILLVEHDMDLVAAYSHRIVALSEGKVLADLPTDRVLQRSAPDRDRDRQAAGLLMLRFVISSSTSRAARCCATCRSRSMPESSSAWSGATAPGRRRASAPSWDFAGRRRARSSSTARVSSACGRIEIARMGIGFAPEESEVFGELTVAENIAMPTWTCPEPAAGRSAHRGRLSRVPQARSATANAMVTRCPAASARWSRSPVRSRSGPSSSCSTSRPRDCRRSSCPRSSRASWRSAPSATRCSSPSPISTTCRSSPTGSTSSSAARSSSSASRTRRPEPGRGADHRGHRRVPPAGRLNEAGSVIDL